MRETENGQPGHARKMHPGGIVATRLRPFDDQHHAGPEQDGEQAAHLAVDKNIGQGPDDDIGRIGAAIGRRTDIGEFRH